MTNTVVFHNPDYTFVYHLLVQQRGEFRVLMQREGAYWTLPHYTPQEHHFGVVQHINRYMWDHYSLHVSTLRCLHSETTDDNVVHRFYALDNLDEYWQPPQGMDWMTELDVQSMPMTSKLVRTITEQWFNWLHSDSSLRAPWVRPGWFLKAADALVDMADRMEMTELTAVEQMRVWARSCTLRINSAQEPLYMKAVPDVFGYEPVVTRVLAIRYPQNSPDVRGVHVANGWMLMGDFGQSFLTHSENYTYWENTIRRYAEIQLDLVKNTQSLIALGVPDRHLDYLASQIPRIANNPPDGLTPDEKAKLKRVMPHLRSLAYDLAEHRVPLTLTHGDLWGGNIIIKPGGVPLFFDWSDSSVSHPFFDIPFLLSEIESELPHVPDARERLRDAYLTMWTRYEPMSSLQKAYQLAEVLGYLHQALIYHVLILPGIEENSRWEMAYMLPTLLRQVLAKIES